MLLGLLKALCEQAGRQPLFCLSRSTILLGLGAFTTQGLRLFPGWGIMTSQTMRKAKKSFIKKKFLVTDKQWIQKWFLSFSTRICVAC